MDFEKIESICEPIDNMEKSSQLELVEKSLNEKITNLMKCFGCPDYGNLQESDLEKAEKLLENVEADLLDFKRIMFSYFSPRQVKGKDGITLIMNTNVTTMDDFVVPRSETGIIIGEVPVMVKSMYDLDTVNFDDNTELSSDVIEDVDFADVQLIMDQTQCTRSKAIEALIKHKGDILSAILEVCEN